MVRYALALCAASLLLFSGSPPAYAQQVDAKEGAETNPPSFVLDSFVESYCLDCHVGDDAEGGIQLDFFVENAEYNDHIETIEKVIRVLKEQQMPPADAELPTVQERVDATDAIELSLDQFDCGAISSPGRVTIRRLNRNEYDNTIRDLTGLDLRLARDFPSDDVGNGFDNIGDVLTIPPILLEKYVDAAMSVAEATMANEAARKKVFPFEIEKEDDIGHVIEVARKNANHFATRAFRRPPTEEEMERLFEVMRATYASGGDQETILKTLMAVGLSSPHFIYKVEADNPDDFVGGIRLLNDFELATRLSYFLWSSMPDERLFELASQGQLHTPEQLSAEVDRMLGDPKAEGLVKNFTGQWLQLRDLELIEPDAEQFASFDEPLRRAMRRETELLFRHLIAEDRSILDLLTADYSFINERLAKHYGLEDIEGDQFRLVSLNDRRGVLMHGSILMLTSNPTRTSPVKRGKWVLDNLLGEPPPPPPPDVPELGETGETFGTLRQQMEQHRENPSCAVCHTKMDALGFGLENFDAVGSWRKTDGNDTIDPAGELPGGKSFSGPLDLVSILAEEKKVEFSRCLSRKMLTFALGRGLSISDRCTINTIVADLQGNEFRMVSLIKSIVTSEPFMTQEVGDPR